MTRIAHFFTSPPFFSNITHFDANKCPLLAKAHTALSFFRGGGVNECGGVNVGSRPHWGVSSILLFLTQIDIDLGV